MVKKKQMPQEGKKKAFKKPRQKKNKKFKWLKKAKKTIIMKKN